MTTPLLNEAAMRVIEEKVARLNGDRGDPLLAALRLKNLQEVQATIGKEIKRISALNSQVTLLISETAAIQALFDTAFAPTYPSPDLGRPGIMIIP
jgi:hypothetical protein